MLIHGWKSQYTGVSSFRHILLSCYSTMPATSTSIEASISLPPEATFLMEFLGFPEQKALSTSTKLSKIRQSRGNKQVSCFSFFRNAGLAISVLKQNGLDQTQIQNAVFELPQMLLTRVDTTLKPKVEFLRGLGLCGSDIADVISAHPAILRNRLDKTILPAFEALREVLSSDENVIRVLKRLKWDLLPGIANYLLVNVTLLQNDYGIPFGLIQNRVLRYPAPFTLRTDLLKDMLVRLEEKWGIPRESGMFLHGLHLLVCVNDKTIDSKCRVFKSFGWTQPDILQLFQRNSYCLALSEVKIKAGLNFFMNELGYEPTYLASRPALLLYNLEKRVLPRQVALQVLKEKGLIKKDYVLYNAACLTESKFLKRFMLPFKDVLPDLYEVYVKSTGCLVQQVIQGKADTQISKIKLTPEAT